VLSFFFDPLCTESPTHGAAFRDCPFGTAPRAAELPGRRPASHHSSARPPQVRERGARTFSMRPVAEAAEQIPQRSRRCSPSGLARKWRRKGLKRLNPRPEMVWPRKPRTPNIWYKSARGLAEPTRVAVAREECYARERGTEIFLAAKP
jgi:hypothetical protein